MVETDIADTEHAGPTAAELIRGQRTGSLIGAIFGLIYVEVNAGPLPGAAALPLRIAGLIAFAAVLTVLVRGWRRDWREVSPDPAAGAPTPDSTPDSAPDSMPDGATARQHALFGRGYWLVVLGEVVALAAGLALLNGPLHTPDAGVAWVSLVVGVHFLPLARLFGLRLFAWLGGAITACGVAGLSLAAAGTAEAPIAAASGVVPGALLLAWAWHGALTLPGPDPAGRPDRPAA